MLSAYFRQLCTPAKVYLIIAVIASVMMLLRSVRIEAVGIKLLFAVMWTFVLNMLCRHGYRNIAWFLVVFPYVVLVLSIIGIARMPPIVRQWMRTLRLQDVFGQEAFTSPAAAKDKR
jgi:hypothetical protein